jgi:predicted PurR-regulated permease PerM
MSQNPYSSQDLTRTILAVLCVSALIASTLWIVRPFVTAFMWAGTIVIATWPLMLRIQAKLGNRRGLATTVMTLALLLILLVPVSFAVASLIGNLKDIVDRVHSAGEIKIPAPPPWVERIPLKGPQISAEWQRMSAEGPDSISAKVAPYAGRIIQWCVGQIGGVGAMMVQFLLTLIISAILYVNGETVGRGIRRFAYRLAGTRGERAATLAAGTVRGVAMGVVVTAIIQTALAAMGLLLASIPGTAVLTAAALLLCLAQLGPILIMLPAVIWKFYSGDTVWGVVLLIFTIVAGGIDNFIRPVLIRRGANLPILLIIAGVIGGLVSFGIMGIFVGPVILAVTYVLLREWVEDYPASRPDAPAEDSASVASV